MLFKVSECHKSKTGEHINDIDCVILALKIAFFIKLWPFENFVCIGVPGGISFNQLSIRALKDLRHQPLEFFTKLLKHKQFVSSLDVHVLSSQFFFFFFLLQSLLKLCKFRIVDLILCEKSLSYGFYIFFRLRCDT
jgi:hypothetical protein